MNEYMEVMPTVAINTAGAVIFGGKVSVDRDIKYT